jgi:nucleotide-binding universal stress UspA family protein
MPVVAAVDRSDRAASVLNRARKLADVHGEELHVAHVADDGTDSLGIENRPDVPSDSGSDDESRRRKAAEVAGGAADRAGVGEFEAVGLLGDPAEELLAYADETDASYVVVSGRKRSPLGQALFGSVTQSLLLNADRPVVAVPHDSEQ